MMSSTLDLSTIFGAVTQQLATKKDALNEADTYNHDHGDHMVKIFNLAQKAVSQKADKPVAEQLEFASKIVENEAKSGSGNLYAQNLSRAAKSFTNTDLNERSVLTLVKDLLGAEDPKTQTPSQDQSDDLLSSLFSGLTGGSGSETPTPPQPQEQDGGLLGSLLSGLTGGSGSETPAPPQSQEQDGGLLGSLLSGLTGSSNSESSQQGIGIDDLLSAGMAYFQSKQEGDSNIEAIMSAILAASPMGKSAHRSQSGTLVASTIMNFAKNFGN